ncbi:hypothetical protein XGA_5016 [Xanthomonas hortorum ATCC 19865]|nr:hypothetical protein XGA_5016 [Xanthomonas hortorum ATCC 19865]
MRRSDALLAEHQYVTVQMRLMDACKGVRIQRLRQIKADHFGAQRGIERHDPNTGRVHSGIGITRKIDAVITEFDDCAIHHIQPRAHFPAITSVSARRNSPADGA